MPQKTRVEEFSEKVSSHKDVQNLVRLFTDITIIEGNWTMDYAVPDKRGEDLRPKAKVEWAETRQALLEDVDRHDFDISKWSQESITALTLTLLSLHQTGKIMRGLILRLAEAHMDDEQTAGISRLIRAIVDSEVE